MEKQSNVGMDTCDRLLKIRCFAPNATEVHLPPGAVEYKFVVDGEWCCQPGMRDCDYAEAGAVWNTFGTRNRGLFVA